LAELHEWQQAEVAREHLDRSHVLRLVELVSHQSAFYRAWPTAAGAMIAEALNELAAKIQATDARTPDEYRARIGVLADEAREASTDQWGSQVSARPAFLGPVGAV
jgi:hypothetical protein